MRVVVVFPWRPTPDRRRPFRFVHDWYIENVRPAAIITADTDPDLPFSRAGSRNAGMRAAERQGADVVIVNDADTVPDLAALREAVVAAHGDGGLHFGLDRMQYLDEEQTNALYAGRWPDVEGRPHDSSVYAVRPSDWWVAGGQDERFDGWGAEDNAWTLTAETLIGVRWHIGIALSLYHDGSCRDLGSERWKPNSALLQRYIAVNGDREAMQALIAERN